MGNEELRLLLQFFSFVFAIGSGVYAHVRTKDTARQQEITALKDRLTKAESKLDDTPTSKALHELALSISDLSGDLRATVARLDGLSGIVERLEKATVRQETFMLHGKGGS